jgi:dihydroorotate dehydrogenase (NAD+) catalytic subunit
VPFAHGLVNAVGLSNPGVDEMVRELAEFRQRCRTPLLASLFGQTPEDFAAVAERLLACGPDLLEVNVSCPNVSSEFGQPFAADAVLTGRITRMVKEKAGKVPVAVKLSLQCPSIGQVARACEDNGADAITAINSVGPGMLIDVGARRPVLANKVGGVSGPAILPMAVRAVWDIHRAVKIPIIGTGGVTTGEDALQMILAGATAVGIGTAVATRGLEVFTLLQHEVRDHLAARGVKDLTELRGAAHA